jgi:hypothetical protein
MGNPPPPNTIYGADTLDKIAELWAKGVKTTEIARLLKIPHGSACRLARKARLRGDPRFPARLFAPLRGPRPTTKPKSEKPRSKPARLKARPKPKHRPAPKSASPPIDLLYPRIYELAANACRYPTGEREGEQRFCAKSQKHGFAYCEEHYTLCTTTARGGKLVAFTGAGARPI